MEAPNNQDKVLASFKQGYNILANAVAGLSENDLDYSPSNGGWSIRQIIHHVADGDDLWKTAVKMALGNEQSEFTLKWYVVFPQTEWAERWGYEKRSIEVSLNLFKANRDHIVQLLENTNEGWTKSVQCKEPDGKTETVPVGFVIQMQTDHVDHHVKRILAIRDEISQHN